MISRRSLLAGATPFGSDGVIAVGGSSDAFMATIRAEVKRWQDFIQRTDIKVE